MKKRILSGILAGAMMLGVLTTAVFAEETMDVSEDTQIVSVQDVTEDSSEVSSEASVIAEYSEDNLSWVLMDDGSLTISGTGEMTESFGRSLLKYKGGIKKVEIMEGVTNVIYGIFCGCRNLETVIMADSVESIGYLAFVGCTSLEKVSLPASLTSLGEKAFMSCNSLVGITLPENLTKIQDQAFANCLNLKNICVSSTIKSIGKNAFIGCQVSSIIVIKNDVNPQILVDAMPSGCTPTVMYFY